MRKSIHSERQKTFCAILIAERKSRKITQIELARRLGKPPSFVAKYELGERRLDVLELIDISKALGADPCIIVRELEQLPKE